MKENKPKSRNYLFKPFGFEVSVHPSWFFLAFLISWTLAAGYFPFAYPGLSTLTYWLMGICGALGLFFSIVFHELCHSLVARRYGLPITGIQLFIFGGVAQMTQEPSNAKTEFFTASIGPISSGFLALIFYLLFRLTVQLAWPAQISGVLHYLGFINLVLAIFNLFPGFPLDGGRILRSILWGWKQDFKWATRIAVAWGEGMGISLIIVGILFFIKGALISGIWTCLIGFFLNNSARSSYQNLLIQDTFKNEKIRQYTKINPITVPPNLNLQSFMDDYFHKYYYKMYPVLDNCQLVGYVSYEVLRGIERENWTKVTIREVMQPCSPQITLDANSSVIDGLQKMIAEKTGRLIVTEQGKLYGVISLKDLSHIIAMKIDID